MTNKKTTPKTEFENTNYLFNRDINILSVEQFKNCISALIKPIIKIEYKEGNGINIDLILSYRDMFGHDIYLRKKYFISDLDVSDIYQLQTRLKKEFKSFSSGFFYN